MDLIDRAALMKIFDTVQKSDPMAYNGRGYDDHFINDAGEPSAEWFAVEDYVLKQPTIEAVPLEPLCEWLCEYTGGGPCFNTSEHCKRTDFPCSIGHKWLDDVLLLRSVLSLRRGLHCP